MKKLNIGFIGNFIPSFSTENHRRWSFEQLGHDVVAFQENSIIVDTLMEFEDKIDLLLYSHTHDPSYVIPNLKEYFLSLRGKIPTASVHLDRWAWLEREKDIGQEATWFTEYQFMADFSPEAQELYKKHNLNAYYLKPGVVEKGCFIAPPDKKAFPHEIVFIGSRGYHPEYPFRPKLIDFLQETYRDKFGHYGNDGIGLVREWPLNVLCSTAKIVVGDSCFGGRPNYVSDRYYEIRGRGGFLLHPKVEGVDHEGVGFYKHDDLNDLKEQIDYYLAHRNEREAMTLEGFLQVKLHETYTQRAQEMLDIIYGRTS